RALADDLGRFLAGEPILARPVGTPERFGRWCKRNPGIAALSGTVAALLVLVAVVSATLAWQLNQPKEFAQQQERVAMEQSDLAIEALGDMVLEVQNELEDTPGALPARMAILQRVMKNLERLNDTPATSDRVRRKHILAHMQIADIHWELAD